jgi:WD40 repeat protein
VPLGKPTPAAGSSGAAVTALMFNSTGQSLYSGTLNGTIDAWTVDASGTLALASQPVPGAQGQQDQITFSNRGQAVMSDASGDTFLYNNLTSRVSPQTVAGGAAVISPGGLTIATRDQSGNITLLNTTQPLNYPLGSQLPVMTPTPEGDQSPGPMSFDADGTMLAAADYGTVMLWHLPVGYQPDSSLPLAAQLASDSIDGNAIAVSDENDAFVQQLSGSMPVTDHVNGTTSGLAEAITALGDDGHLLALGEENGSVSLWSLRNGKALLLFPSISADVTSMSLSVSGKLLAVGASNSTVSLWNLADPADPAFITSTDSGGLVAISPDGGTLAILDAGHLQLWDVSDPNHWSAIDSGFRLGTASSGVTALALSPGGKMLAVATTAGTVQLWNLGSTPAAYGQPLASNYDSDYNYLQTRVDSVGVNALAFSADGTTLTSLNADSTIRIWDLGPATVIRNICGAAAGALTSAVWNQYLPGEPYQSPCRTDAAAVGQGTAAAAPASSGANGGRASLCTASQLGLSGHATTSDDSGVTEYVLILILTNRSRSSCSLTGVPSVSLDGPPDPPLGGTYQLVSNALPGQAAVALAPGAQAHVNLTYLPATGSTGGGTWVPKTVTMILPGTNGTLTMPWSLGVAVVRQDMASEKGTFTGPFLAGSGPAAGSGTSPAPAATSLKVDTCATGASSAASAPTEVGSITTGPAENDFVDVAFSPNCQVVAAGGNGMIQIRNMVTGTSIATLSAAPGSAVDIDAFTPDGKALAVAGGNGHTTLWDAATGSLEASFPSDLSGGTYCLAVSPDSSEVFTGGSTGNVGIWSVTSHQSLGTISTGSAVGAMALSPNGQLLAVAGYDETIRIYNTTSRALTASLPSDDGHIWSMTFSPDGTALAVGSNVIQWWNIASHNLITQAISPGGSVTDVAFNPDGTILAAGGYRMVGLWNTSTHQLITTLNLGQTAATASVNASYPNGMAFSRYGAILAVGWYGKLEFWNVAR